MGTLFFTAEEQRVDDATEVLERRERIKGIQRRVNRRQNRRHEAQRDDLAETKQCLRNHRESQAEVIARRMAHRETYILADEGVIAYLDHMDEQLQQCHTAAEIRDLFVDNTKLLAEFAQRLSPQRFSRVQQMHSRVMQHFGLTTGALAEQAADEAPDPDELAEAAHGGVADSATAQRFLGAAKDALVQDEVRERAAKIELERLRGLERRPPADAETDALNLRLSELRS